jgi:transcriptional regulator with XRE-family HTH domain
MKPLGRWIEETGVSLDELVERSGLDRQTVKAIATGNYTPSPQQRQRLAQALNLSVDDVSWGHAVPVEHLWGHGPQFGRNP